MSDKINRRGEIEHLKAKRGASQAGSDRDYYKLVNTKARRNARRAAPLGWDPLDLRGAGVEGSNLEKIVYKRLTEIWGPEGIAFIYKYAIGSAPGVKNARAFAGGVEMDFVILNRPSGKEMALEVQGAHWHGPSEFYADTERALAIEATGRDYRELWEYEILLGDEYLDMRILQLIGANSRVGRHHEIERTIRSFTRELGAPES